MRFREIQEYVENTPNNMNPVILKQFINEYVNFVNNPLSEYTIDANISDSVDLFGKVASDLQKNVNIIDGKFYGDLNYVTNYTGFSGDPAEQQGYYVVFHVAYEGADYIKVNGVTLDVDGIHILLIKNMKNPKATIEIKKNDNILKDTIDLSGLNFN